MRSEQKELIAGDVPEKKGFFARRREKIKTKDKKGKKHKTSYDVADLMGDIIEIILDIIFS